MGKDVSYTGYVVQDGVSRDNTKLDVLKLVSVYVLEAAGYDPNKEFLFSCEERDWAIVI